MAVIDEGILLNENGTMSFGNYSVIDKLKKDFSLNGEDYYLKTHNEVTKLKKNGNLLFEAIPGATVHNLEINEKIVTFKIEGKGNTQITLELLPSKEYSIKLDDIIIGNATSNMSGKFSFSLNLTSDVNEIIIESK